MRRLNLPALSALLLLACARPPAPVAPPAPDTAQSAPEQSVRPGINDSWRGDRIDRMVRRLESESREIWTQRDRIIEVVAARPGMVVADIGAGTGFLTLLLARAVGPGGQVYALDINPTLLANIDLRATETGLGNIKTMRSAEDTTPLAPGSVDLVLMCDAYHHFEFPRSTMRSIHAALRPGGELVLIDLERIPGTTSPAMLEHVRAGKDVFFREILADGFELVTEHEVPELEENYILRFRKQ